VRFKTTRRTLCDKCFWYLRRRENQNSRIAGKLSSDGDLTFQTKSIERGPLTSDLDRAAECPRCGWTGTLRGLARHHKEHQR